jgi:hypothetical protein
MNMFSNTDEIGKLLSIDAFIPDIAGKVCSIFDKGDIL